MGLFSRFEDKAEGIIEGSGSARGGGIEPVKLAKRAYKEMQREKMVGVGHEYAPTLYNVLVSVEDDSSMSSIYPSLAGEIETYLSARAESSGLVFDCPPLVRFIVDEGLKRGRFDIIAESVSPSIIKELRREEMQHYGIQEGASSSYNQQGGYGEQNHNEPAFGYSSRPHDDEDAPFDPLIPSDMQSASYVVPEEERAHINQPAAGQALVGQGAQAQPVQAGGAAQPVQQVQPQAAAQVQAGVAQAAQVAGQQGVRQAQNAAQAGAQQVAAGAAQAGQQAGAIPQQGAQQVAGAAQQVGVQQPAAGVAQAGIQQQPAANQHQQQQPAAGVAQAGLQQQQPANNQQAIPVQASAEATTVVPQTPQMMNGYLYNYATQQRFVLTGNRVILGREISCDIQINDPSVSRHHAELLYGADGWTVRDTGSTNGTSLNGAPINQSRVFNGDLIKLGNTELQFQEG